MDCASLYNRMALRLLGRNLKRGDGLSEGETKEAEKRLKLKLPRAMSKYYRVAGNLVELNKPHNQLLDLSDLAVEDDCLIFMDENQSVVSWVIRLEGISLEDPEVLQRNTSAPVQWHREEKTVYEFLEAIFAWQAGFEEE